MLYGHLTVLKGRKLRLKVQQVLTKLPLGFLEAIVVVLALKTGRRGVKADPFVLLDQLLPPALLSEGKRLDVEVFTLAC